MLLEALEYALKQVPPNTEGTIFEFGVASGITYLQLAQAIRQNEAINLVGFDSFQGLPKEADGVWTHAWHSAGEHAFVLRHVEEKLLEAGLYYDPRFKIVPGWFAESLKSEPALSIVQDVKHLLLVNIDVDLYISTIQLLDYCLPAMRKGTVLYFDDWKDPRFEHPDTWGEHRAWEEWSAVHPQIEATTVRVGENNERYMVITNV
jgi:hypothetical protein